MSDDDDFGGQTTGVRHTFDVTPLIRPEPPTEAVRRGKERLLAGLSALASSPNDATLPSDSASGSFRETIGVWGGMRGRWVYSYTDADDVDDVLRGHRVDHEATADRSDRSLPSKPARMNDQT